MQAKYCLLLVLLIGSIIASTDGFVPMPPGGKREVQKIFKLKYPLVFYFVATLSISSFFVFASFLSNSHRFALFRTITVTYESTVKKI